MPATYLYCHLYNFISWINIHRRVMRKMINLFNSKSAPTQMAARLRGLTIQCLGTYNSHYIRMRTFEDNLSFVKSVSCCIPISPRNLKDTF